MGKSDMVRAYAESLLKQILGTNELQRDPDGDYRVRHESALYYVRVIPGVHDDPIVQVFAIVLADVAPVPKLFERLNTVNTQLHFARAFWVGNQVLIESEIVGEDLSLSGFEIACRSVARAADYFGPRLAEEFGGKTAFADEQGPDYEDPTVSFGQYL